jgi:multicomponent Na+:H+ antiporter subunit B
MTSLILRTTTRFLLSLLLLFSLFLLLSGHNDPGGGFAGSLTVAIGLGAEAFFPLATKAAEQLLAPTDYIQAVLGKAP